ncbi:MAG: hypothetical protein IKU64_01310 [Bacteroides sp.]|nr:hypothetical protein [Bacteroides sp.]
MAVGAMILAMHINAQNAYDAERLLGNDLNGTARYVGMGGAMSALGGDISVIGSNPAGIGIFRSNDFSVTLGLNNATTVSLFNGTTMEENKTRASFDQLGFVYTYKVGNNTSLRYVNFGFNYHKSKNFNRFFSAGGQLNNFSQSWQLAEEMNVANKNLKDYGPEFYFDNYQAFEDNLLNNKNPYEKYWNKLPVLGVLGATTGVVDYYDGVLGWDGYSNNFFSKESGYISQYDFNISFNLEDRFYLGATLGIYDVNYDRYSSYTEVLNDDYGDENGGYTLDNYYGLDGAGVDLKLGAIFRPIEDSPFRMGLAIHTPTWYDLTESYNATLSSDILAYDSPYSQTLSDYLDYGYLSYDYCMVTPWKFNVSAGTTLGGLVALGAEYEYANYGSSKLMDMEGYELGNQSDVEAFLKGVHTLRVGMEARLLPQFSLRAGYNYTSAVFTDDAYSALTTYRTSTDFNNIKGKNTFTFGLGYRGNVIYADLAYKYDMYKSDFYAFDDIDLPVTKVDNERHQLLFTLGARF